MPYLPFYPLFVIIILMKISQDIINKIKSYFSQKPKVVAVYLYGSFTKGTAREDSDIDLAILAEKSSISSDLQIEAMSDLGLILGKEVEVQNLNICKTTFAYRVISEGKIIYEKNPKQRVIFETEIMRRYFDMRPLLDEFSEQITSLARSGRINARPFSY